MRLLPFLSIFLFFLLFTLRAQKIQPLQPIRAIDLSSIAQEPSGITYCENTNHLYAICDKCYFIYEFNINGVLISTWAFSSTLRDIEAVACDVNNNSIYIAQEGTQQVVGYLLPINHNWYPGNHLIPIDSFTIQSGYHDKRSGIEGLTVDTKRNVMYAVKEKNPPLFFTLSMNGTILQTTHTDYSADLSGLAYDSDLDLVWVVSDISERLFAVDLAGEVVFDYWDLPVTNAEGVAVDNQHKPPLLFVTTDPSGGHGPNYVAALFTFIKPAIGTGLTFYNASNPPNYPPVPCNGCDLIWEEVAQLEIDKQQAEQHKHQIIWISVLVPITCGLIVFVILILFFVVVWKTFKVPITRRVSALKRKFSKSEESLLDDLDADL